VALGEDAPARRSARSASAVPVACTSLGADELRRRRLARALATLAEKLGRSEPVDEAAVLRGAGPHAGGYVRLVQAVRRRRARRPADGPLTATELDVLRLVAAGRTAPQIAAVLRRSTHTVRTHLRNIGIKLDTHGRAGALARARELGILAPP
jgi:DNA-binding CsgD family transcriptional regulator